MAQWVISKTRQCTARSVRILPTVGRPIFLDGSMSLILTKRFPKGFLAKVGGTWVMAHFVFSHEILYSGPKIAAKITFVHFSQFSPTRSWFFFTTWAVQHIHYSSTLTKCPGKLWNGNKSRRLIYKTSKCMLLRLQPRWHGAWLASFPHRIIYGFTRVNFPHFHTHISWFARLSVHHH